MAKIVYQDYKNILGRLMTFGMTTYCIFPTLAYCCTELTTALKVLCRMPFIISEKVFVKEGTFQLNRYNPK